MSRIARFAWAVLAGNVAVILWGSFVRATGSGAGCGGHWPTCNGDVVPRAPSIATLIELSHRATSGLAFIAVMVLGVLVLLATRETTGEARPPHPARATAVVAMALMCGEVAIGAMIVLLGKVALDPSLMHGVFTELHAGNTFLLLAALTLTAHHLGGAPRVRFQARGPVVLSLGQAFAGLALTVGSGAIAALGDTLFPSHSLREGLEQDLSPGAHVFLHLRTLHPLLAVIAFVLVIGACTSLRARDDVPAAGRTLAGWVMVAVSAQMVIGAMNLWLLVPIPTQMLHLAFADVVFILLVLTTGHALGETAASGATPSAHAVAAVPVG